MIHQLQEVIVMASQNSTPPTPTPVSPSQIFNVPTENPLSGTRVGVGLTVLLIAATVLLAPALVIAFGVFWWCWYLGWPGSRMRNVLAAWVVCVAVSWAFDGSPITWWLVGVRRLTGGDLWGLGDTLVAETTVGLVLGALVWATYERTHRSGHAQERGERFERRQTVHRTRSARHRGTQGYTPLTNSANDKGVQLVLGQLIETETRLRPGGVELLTARHRWWLTIELSRLFQHMVVLGLTGAGKSTLLRRLALAWTAAMWAVALRRATRDQERALVGAGAPDGAGGEPGRVEAAPAHPRPLCIFVDAKGGEAAAQDGAAWCAAFQALGVPQARTLCWPFDGRLDMWRMDGQAMVESLDAISANPEEPDYFRRLRRRLLQLVCKPPQGGTPQSGPELLSRMTRGWLTETYRGREAELADVAALGGRGSAGRSQLDEVRLLYRERFTTLGSDFDAGMPLSDVDALYCSLPGTGRPQEAGAKAVVLIELLLSELTSAAAAGEAREVLFIFDEFSAVRDAVEIAPIVERVRSLGGRVVISSQTWEGLGRTEDSRHRVATDVGTTVVMQMRAPQQVCELAGSKRRLESTRRREDGGSGARVQDQYLLSPDRVRSFGVGEFAVFGSPGRGQAPYSVSFGYCPPVTAERMTTEVQAMARGAQEPEAAQHGERLSGSVLEAGWRAEDEREHQGSPSSSSSTTAEPQDGDGGGMWGRGERWWE